MRAGKMTVEKFPLCCKASIIVNFPQGDQEDYSSNYSKEQVRAFVEDALTAEYNDHKALVVAITTKSQTIANKVLKDLGFSYSKWSPKYNPLPEYNRGTKLRLWFYPLVDLPENLVV